MVDSRTTPPDVRPAKSLYLQVAQRESWIVFVPVVFRYKGAWCPGVLTEWIRSPGSLWMARILHADQGAHTVFDFDPGSLIPLALDLSGDEPVLRPATRANVQ